MTDHTFEVGDKAYKTRGSYTDIVGTVTAVDKHTFTCRIRYPDCDFTTTAHFRDLKHTPDFQRPPKTRLSEVNELLNDKSNQLSDLIQLMQHDTSDWPLTDKLNHLIAEKVKLEIEKHDLERT